MAATQYKNAWMSEVDPRWAPLIPAVDEAFKKIWTYDTINEFRQNWTTIRSSYADYVPTEGFSTSHQTVPVSDGTEIEIRLYRPTSTNDTASLPLLFVMHGGGWVVGGHDSENSMCRTLCVKNTMSVLSVDYRRAPEFKFPTALNDGYDVYKWMLEHASQIHVDTTRIILAGTSAGANLVAGLSLKLRDAKMLQGVLGQMLNLPAVCHPNYFSEARYELNSYEQNAKAPTINGETMKWFWKQYFPEPTPNPLASPLLAASHADLPPTLIQVAGLDALRDEGIAYANALKQAGNSVQLNLYPGLPHGFVLAVKLDVVNKYYASMVNWASRMLNVN